MKILVAESNKPLREELAILLVSAGYRVVVASDGHGVQNHFLSVETPDLVVVDDALPAFDLPSFLASFSNKNSSARPYILMLSGDSNCPYPVDDCLAKPFHVDLLISRVLIGKRLVEIQRKLADCEKEFAVTARVSSTDQDSLFYLLDSLDALVYASDLNTHELMFINAAAQDVYCGEIGDDCRQSIDNDRIEPSLHCMKEKLLDKNGNPCGPYVWEFHHTETGAWYQSREQAIYWLDGRLVHLSIANSITDRVRAEEVLRASEKGLRAIHDAAFEAVFLAEKGVCLSQNLAAKKLFGYTLDEAVGKPSTDWVIPEDRERLIRNMYVGYELPYEVTALRKDGSTFPAEAQARMIMYQGRQVRMTALRDITDRKKAAEIALSHERRFKEFFDSIDDAIFVHPLREEGFANLVEVNETACRKYGYTREEFLQMTVRDITLDIVIGENTKDKNRKKLVGDGNLVFESVHISKTGETFPVEINTNIVERFGKKVIFSVVRDITERKKSEELVREQERRYEDVFTSVNDAILVYPFSVDANEIISEVNDAACQMFGYTREEFLQLCPRKLLPERILKEYLKSGTRKQLLSQKHMVLEFLCVKKSGEEFPVEVSANIVERSGQQMVFGVVRDITERKEAENLVKEQERRFEQLFDSIEDAVFMHPVQKKGFGTFLEVNETACRNYGYTHSEFRQMTPQDITPQKIFDEVVSTKIRQQLLEKKQLVFESTHVRKSGEEFPVELSSRIIERFGQEVILSVARDITERKKAEEKVREQERRFEQYFSSVSDAIAVHPFEFGSEEPAYFIEVNDAACRQYGYTKEEFSRLTARDLTVGDGYDELKEKYLEDLLNGKQMVIEAVHVKKTGEKFPVEINSIVIERDGRQVMLTVGRDLTERKKAEAEALKQQKRFEEIFTSIDDAILVHPFEKDGSGNFIEVNAAAIRLCGYSRDEMMQRTARDIAPDLYADEHMVDQFRHKILQDRHIVLESFITTKGGTKVPIEVNSNIVERNGQEVVMSVVRDITERKKAEEAVREQEQRFEKIFSSVNDAIFLFPVNVDEYKTFIEVNAVACQRYGYTREEFLQLIATDITVGITPDEAKKRRKALLDGEDVIFEAIHRTKLGRQFPVEINASLMDYAGQKVILSVARDITERKQAEEVARAHEERFKDFFDSLNDAVFVHPIIPVGDGWPANFIEVNDAACQYFGYTHEEFMDMSVKDIVSEQVFDEFIGSGSREKFLEQKQMLLEVVALCKDGTEFPVEISMNIVERFGKPVMISVVRDITERKEAEALVSAHEQKIKDYFDSINDGVYVYPLKEDRPGNFIEVNKTACERSGVSREEFLQRKPSFLANDTQDPDLWQEFLEKKNQVFETVAPAVTGEMVPVEVSRNIVEQFDGKVVFSVVRDISERKQAEILAKEQEQRFEDYFRSLNDAVFVYPLQGRAASNFIEVNETACKLTGYSREELYQRAPRSMILDLHVDVTNRRKLMKEKKQVFETILLTKSKEEVPVEISRNIVERFGEQVVLSIVRDISERKRAEAETQAHEQRFKTFFDSVNDSVFVLPFDGDAFSNFIEVNDTACRKYGYSYGEFLQLTLRDIIPDVDFDEHISITQRKKLLNDGDLVFETTHKKRSGEEFPVEINCSIIERFGEKVSLAVVRDITDRKRAEAEARAHEERFKVFFDSVNDSVAVYPLLDDGPANFIEVNKTACKRFGYSREECSSLSPRDVVLETHADPEQWKRLQKDKVQYFETIGVTKSGEQFPVEISRSVMDYYGQQVVMAVVRDISERKQAEAEKRAQQKRFKEFFNSIDDAILVHPLREKGFANLLEVNEALCRKTGFTREELANMTAKDIFPEVVLGDTLRSKNRKRLMKNKRLSFETFMRTKSGELIPVETNVNVVERFGEQVLFSVVRDISKRKEAEEKARVQEHRFETFFASVNDAIFVYPLKEDGCGTFVEVNKTACRYYGYSREEFLRLTPKDLTRQQSRDQMDEAGMCAKLQRDKQLFFEAIHVTKSGEGFPVEINMNVVEQGGQQMVLGVIRNISERKKAEEKIERMAFYDGLTDLPNRRLFLEQLQQAVQTLKREKKQFALLMIDLDHFKDVNDSLGHPVGDLLLKAVAQRISAVVRSSDIFARFGGDEFVLLQTDCKELTDVTGLAEKVIAEVGRDFEIDGHTVWINCSIGIVVYNKPDSTVDELLSKVDSALYKAKEIGRGTYAFYEDAMTLSLQRELVLTQELAKAIGRDELFVEYQPQIDLANGRMVGVEALVRWNHPVHGVLLPGHFIPIAEKRGLIRDLSNWVMREAFRQSAQWAEAKLRFGRIAINLCAQQLSHRNFEADVRKGLAESGADPSTLEFEFTETVLIDAAERTIETISNLSKLGIGFAIDDFGTGFSSLSYLRKLHTDKIKIDREFVRDIHVDSGAEKIISATIALGKTLGLATIGEGVETSDQAEFLKKHGCDFAQGFYYDKAMSPARLEELWLKDDKVANIKAG